MRVSDYQYDVFISYPRIGQTPDWVEEHFVPALKHCVSLELGREPEIYFDKRLALGTTWPVDLGEKLAQSRVLISLWTRNYLGSDWCDLELAHMLARERETGLRSKENANGIVILIIVHDGETNPHHLNKIQTVENIEYFNPKMRKDGKKSERFYDKLKKHAESIAELIENAPPWKPEWETQAADEFLALFDSVSPKAKNARARFTEL